MIRRWLARLLWWRRPRYKGVTIQWDIVNAEFRRKFIPRLADSFAEPSAMLMHLSRRSRRPILVDMIRGWQRVSPALTPPDSWLAWRAIVNDYRHPQRSE